MGGEANVANVKLFSFFFNPLLTYVDFTKHIFYFLLTSVLVAAELMKSSVWRSSTYK